jgi:cytochrome c553
VSKLTVGRNIMRVRFAHPLAMILCGISVGALRADEVVTADRSLEKDVRSILQTRCWSCHGEKKQESGLRLDFRDRAIAGGDSGPAIVSGRAEQSALLHRVTSTDEAVQMPPDGKRLSAQEVGMLRRWIDSGASGLPETATEPAWRRHWAFQPIRRPVPPAIRDNDSVRNPIDAFVIHRLEREGLELSPCAQVETLVRRATLDMVGLLPAPDRVRAFIDSEQPDRWQRLIDELTASPHYGERWGRHWLDVARYADSAGYESDKPREIWAYRDWVIDAMNADKPFDRFVIEQIAGDLLPKATDEQRIATGFHCNAILDGGVRWQAVVDRVNTTSAAFLGLTTECARCHSHRTDPLTQREFYQLFAFFNDGSMRDFELKPAGVQTAGTPAKTLIMKHSPVPTHVLIRGDPRNPGPRVEPGVPAFLHSLNSTDPAGANRLDLARWLTDSGNPLTARVTVNRIWQRYFGRGLVPTESDFGMQTPRPEHAELLDWLASELVAGGWSLKRLHRLILNSATYRQSSHVRRELSGIDPENRLLARQVRLRLPAEVIRDVFLDAGGLLDRRIGGPSVFPWQPDGILNGRATPAEWKLSGGGDRYRRGLYTWNWRLTPHPHLPLFDAPDGIASCTRRSESNVPVQALTLLNDPAFVECASSFSQAVVNQAKADPGGRSDDNLIAIAFDKALSRTPTQPELLIIRQLLDEERRTLQTESATRSVARDPDGVQTDADAVELASWTAVCRTILNLDEFYTRE